MTSFTSLLSSIGGGQPAAPQPKRPTHIPNPVAPASSAGKPEPSRNDARSTPNNAAAGVKRKADEQVIPAATKVIKTEVKVPVRPPGQPSPHATAKPVSSATAGAPYRGTARASGATNPSNAVPKPIPKPVVTASASNNVPSVTVNGTAKPKRGFASLMEKAKAAQEVAKAAGSSTIKHKAAEKLTKRDRQRLREEAAKQKAGQKTSKLIAADRSRSGTPVNVKPVMQKKPEEPAYKGTMRKPIERQEVTYKGTMNRGGSGISSGKQAAKKNLAKDKYGGYASWSDLDDAEDEEGDYDESDASSDMMDAGFDDMEAEERRALQAAKKEDQEALEEEERHRQLKLERKKKLQALSKNAAARKKY